MDYDLKKYLLQGEGVQLDYKETITNANKIAKTLAAFSNTEGGVILVGIKDNKTICGVAPEEEKFMINLANEKFCKPKASIFFSTLEHEGKSILKITVAPGTHKPYKAKDEQGNWKAYVRVEDSTILASVVWYKAEILKKRGLGHFEFGVLEKAILNEIKISLNCTLTDLINTLPFTSKDISTSLSKMLYAKQIKISYQNKQETFALME